MRPLTHGQAGRIILDRSYHEMLARSPSSLQLKRYACMRVIDLFCIVNILLKGQHYCTNPLHRGLKSGITAGSAGRWIWVESDETNHHHRFLIRRSSYFHNNKKIKKQRRRMPTRRHRSHPVRSAAVADHAISVMGMGVPITLDKNKVSRLRPINPKPRWRAHSTHED